MGQRASAHSVPNLTVPGSCASVTSRSSATMGHDIRILLASTILAGKDSVRANISREIAGAADGEVTETGHLFRLLQFIQLFHDLAKELGTITDIALLSDTKSAILYGCYRD